MKALIGASIVAMLTGFPAMAGTIDVYEGQSIEAALKKAKSGDTVAVHAGTYNESIYAKVSGVKLVSADGVGAAHIKSSGTPLFLQGGSNNTIQGFAITGGAKGNGIQVGGTVSNFAEGYTVKDNIIKNAGLDGIKVHQATGFTFSGNVIENAGTGNGGNYDGGVDFVAVKDSIFEGNTVIKTGGNSCLMMKGGTAGNTISGNTLAGCKDAIHLGGKTGEQFKAPGSGVKEAYDNVVKGNNLCGTASAIYFFDGEKKRQDNTVQNNECNGADIGIDVAGADTTPQKPPLKTHADIPKEKLPDNSAAQAEAKKSLVTLASAKKTLTQATATKLPSMSMAEMRQQIAEKNKVNCN